MTDGQATAGGLGQPSVFQWAATAWRDALAAFRQMPGVLGIAALASFTINLVTLPLLSREGFGGDVASTIVMLLDGFVLTPAAIAVHRFVLLGECATKYRLEPSEPRFRRFFFFVVVIELIPGIPIALADLAQNIPGRLGAASILVLVAITFAGLVLVLRLLLLFPAIAVDAPGAAWINALRDTRGHSWRMLFIVIVTGIPLLVLFGLAYGLMFYVLTNLGGEVLGRMVFSILLAIRFALSAVLYAALASRMFAAFGDRLKAPADQPAPAAA